MQTTAREGATSPRARGARRRVLAGVGALPSLAGEPLICPAAERCLPQMESLRALGQLAGGVAHDLNNLLMIIQGHVELGLHSGALSPEVEQNLRTIRESATDAAQVVRRVQAFYRPWAQAQWGLVHLNDVVKAAVAQVEGSLPALGRAWGQTIRVDLQLAPLPPAEGNERELGQLFTNLLLNAVDAMPHGGVISICTAYEGGRIAVQVKDTGVGMSEEVLSRVFEPFFTTKGEAGTGLGLAIARWTVQRHRGEIAVESVPGVGTAFTLHFPVASSVPPPVAEPEVSNPAPLPMTVVVIDDEPMVAGAIGAMIVRMGHHVRLATSGGEGVDLVEEGVGDLVLVDLGMRDVDGWQVVQAVKNRRPPVPVYLLTGYEVALDPEEAARAGATGVVAKPISYDALAAVLAGCARAKASIDAGTARLFW